MTERVHYTNSNGYKYRKPITIDQTQVSGTSNLTDFPVVISETDADLADSANGGNVQSSNGYDIRFELSDGTKLDHEIEKYVNTTGELVAHVRIPSLSATADTEIYMYYGNPDVATTEENAVGVWESSYKAVYHLSNTLSAIGERITVVLSDSIDGGYVRNLTFKQSYVNPVVVAFRSTNYGLAPTTVRAKNVTSTGCDIFMQEPSRTTHSAERVNVIIMESGAHTLPGGYKVEAGIFTTSSHKHADDMQIPSNSVQFSSPFNQTPAVLHMLNTYNNNDWKSTSCANVTTASVGLIQEESHANTAIATEDIGWIAIEPHSTYYSQAGVQSSGGNFGIADAPATLNWNPGFSNLPIFVVSQNTMSGNAGSWLAAGGNYDTDSDGTGITVEAEETDSSGHTTENMGYWLLADSIHQLIWSESGGVVDSTINNRDGAPQGFMTDSKRVPAKISDGLSFDGGDDYVHLSSASVTQGNFTVGVWAKTTGRENATALSQGIAANWSNDLFIFYIGDSVNANGGVRIWWNTTIINYSTPINDDAWHHIQLTRSGSSFTLYVDGVQVATGTGAANFTSDSFTLGAANANGAATQHYIGSLDEARVSNAVRSADWIATEYANQSSPGTFYAVGEQGQLTPVSRFDGTDWIPVEVHKM